MKIIEIYCNTNIHIEEHYAACIGYFDGLHKGHQALIEKTKAVARQAGLKSALITFDPDPWVVIKGDVDIHHITTIEDRISICEAMGLDAFFIIRFTREFSLLEPREFVAKITNDYGIKHIVCGFDFRFGKGGSGNITTLKALADHDFAVTVIEPVNLASHKISSTQICHDIEQGEMEAAAHALGRPYTISGFVIGGRRQGTKIGFPTANLSYSSEYVLPKNGVYIGMTKVLGKEYMSMINIGHNPTFNHRKDVSIETNILDFDQMIYGEKMAISFLHYRRSELKLDSLDQLIAVMRQDAEATRDYFNENPIA